MTERISYPMPNGISNQAFVLRQGQFIRYQYKQWTGLLNLDHVIKVSKTIDQEGTFTLFLYTTLCTEPSQYYGDEAEALWDALNAQPSVSIRNIGSK